MVRMEQLREQGELEEERHSAEVADLEDQVDEEWNKCRQQLDNVRRRLEARATEVWWSQWQMLGWSLYYCIDLIMTQASLSKLKRSVHQKAIQNRIMEKVWIKRMVTISWFLLLPLLLQYCNP